MIVTDCVAIGQKLLRAIGFPEPHTQPFLEISLHLEYSGKQLPYIEMKRYLSPDDIEKINALISYPLLAEENK